MKTQIRILSAARWLSLALATHTFALAALAQSPLPDPFDPGADGWVGSLAVQADGKILVGGGFGSLGGQYSSRLGRLNADGTLETSFDLGVSHVNSLAVQADGKILVGGPPAFSESPQSGIRIFRLNADGTPDTGFNLPFSEGDFPPADYVNCLALQADGRILVGGYFNTLGAQSRANIGRLNADGMVDTRFNPRANGTVNCLALQADGKILVGGGFTTLGGQSRTNLGRLNADGTLDASFNPGANSLVNSLALQADGKILVVGEFTSLGGQSREHIGRLNADGTLDTSFNPGVDGWVDSLALQADGKILVGGYFAMLGGQSRANMGRLNADGTLDTSFNPGVGGPNPWVHSLAVQADGQILVGGGFTTLGGQSRTNIGRLNSTGPATQNLSFDGSTLTWTRGDTSPEAWRTTFEDSPDGGASWTSLGGGVRIPGGWELTGLALPTNTTLRARGYTVGRSSSGLVETTIGLPAIITQPASLTNNAGTTAAFSVHGVGGGPLSYQWRQDGGNLADGGNVSGAASASLTLSNVLRADAGRFSVVITNAVGSLTSAVATLTVIDPAINVQPASQPKNGGDSVTLSVTAGGTPPLSYQWRHDGVVQAWATQSSVLLTNLQEADAGSYDVVVSNAWGSVTSTVALLSVNLAIPDSFNPGVGGPNPWVNSLAVQADGKILVVGGFTALGGQSRTNIGRLNANGTLDSTFNPGVGGPNPWVNSLAVQADGKILVVGGFTTLGGQSRTNLGRLNADGTLDSTFNPGVGGPDPRVQSLALQADGKILVVGEFTSLGGQSREHIGRLNANGTLDTNFNPGVDGWVDSLALQVDGKILVSGGFTTLGGQSRTNLGRLEADGTLDTSFNPGVGGTPDFNVAPLAVQGDGKILVGVGNLWTPGGLRRLNADGTLDTSFNPGTGGSFPYVSSLALQTDGKILVGGLGSIGRLNADGTLDSTFNPGVGGLNPWVPGVSSLAVQADGEILVGGGFTTLGGQSRTNIGRLNSTGPATQSLTFDGSTLTWTRGGTSPEVWRTTFEDSPDGGTSWTSLGGGVRIPGGWELTGLALPTNTTLRARGYTVGGSLNGSSWFVETVLRPAPAIFDILHSANGQFGFSVGGPAGRVVVVEASPDLTTWWPLQTNTLGAGALAFTDPQPAFLPSRFYRLRPGP